MAGPAMTDCTCDNCGGAFRARVADRNRGWARFCNKSCKASYQVEKKGDIRPVVEVNPTGKKARPPKPKKEKPIKATVGSLAESPKPNNYGAFS